jgi:hypothetical protein
MFVARSIVYYNDYEKYNLEHSDKIVIPAYFMSNYINSNEDLTSLLVRLYNVETGLDKIVCLGAPHNDDKCIVYVPRWILDSILYEPGGALKILPINNNISLPIATKIIIKSSDDILFELDFMAELEKVFNNLTIVEKDMTIPVKLDAFGGYYIYITIDSIEPGARCKLGRGDLNIDFVRNMVEPKAQIVSDISIKEEDISIKEEVLDKEISAEERRKKVREVWSMRS